MRASELTLVLSAVLLAGVTEVPQECAAPGERAAFLQPRCEAASWVSRAGGPSPVVTLPANPGQKAYRASERDREGRAPEESRQR